MTTIYVCMMLHENFCPVHVFSTVFIFRRVLSFTRTINHDDNNDEKKHILFKRNERGKNQFQWLPKFL